MRGSIADVSDALSARKLGSAAGTSSSASLRVLYLKRKEFEHRLRIVNAIESLAVSFSIRINKYIPPSLSIRIIYILISDPSKSAYFCVCSLRMLQKRFISTYRAAVT